MGRCEGQSDLREQLAKRACRLLPMKTPAKSPIMEHECVSGLADCDDEHRFGSGCSPQSRCEDNPLEGRRPVAVAHSSSSPLDAVTESTCLLSYSDPSLQAIPGGAGLGTFAYNDINPRSSRRNISRLQIPRLVPLDNLDSLARCHGGGVIIA
jgi:hypothetical protein